MPKKLLIYTDGGSRNNPGEAGAGAILYEGETIVGEVSEYLGVQTNNWAEYEAVTLALKKAIDLDYEGVEVLVRLDSKLVCEQLMGNWKIKEPTLLPQAEKARALFSKFHSVTFEHVRREHNKEADRLANEAMDRAES